MIVFEIIMLWVLVFTLDELLYRRINREHGRQKHTFLGAGIWLAWRYRKPVCAWCHPNLPHYQGSHGICRRHAKEFKQ